MKKTVEIEMAAKSRRQKLSQEVADALVVCRELTEKSAELNSRLAKLQAKFDRILGEKR
jgi:hypothetical protein